jgi:hypothetical protein
MMRVYHRVLNHFKTKIALEAAANGVMHKEPEHDFYAILADWSELAHSSRWEQQEQWVLRVDKAPDGSKGLVRVRKTIPNGTGLPEYTMAVKNKTSEDETETSITEDMFNAFARLSNDGQVKDRYFFPIAGTELFYEVDCFLLPEAQHSQRQGYQTRGLMYVPWVKIDLEVRDKKDPIPAFPFLVKQVIKEPYGRRTEQDEKIVSDLYKKQYVAINPFVK